MKYYRYTSSISIQENKNLQKYYLDLKDQAETVKTHFFEGRYENIYINKEKIPHLSLILNEALIFATTILKCQSPLKAREFIFFAPDLIHGVKRSHSQKMRLSIGMNFGPA